MYYYNTANRARPTHRRLTAEPSCASSIFASLALASPTLIEPGISAYTIHKPNRTERRRPYEYVRAATVRVRCSFRHYFRNEIRSARADSNQRGRIYRSNIVARAQTMETRARCRPIKITNSNSHASTHDERAKRLGWCGNP